MKTLVLALAVGVLFSSFVMAVQPAAAAPAFEDPQLCLNGMLLRVDPTTAAIDVWVTVGSEVDIDFNVANCGGDASLATVDPSQVSVSGENNSVQVTVVTASNTDVVFSFDGKDKTKNSGHDDSVGYKFKAK